MSNSKSNSQIESNSKIKVSNKKKIALVCSGGGAKAFAFHAGVITALQHKGFTFLSGLNGEPTNEISTPSLQVSTYIGSSVGAILICILAAGYPPDEILSLILQGNGKIQKFEFHKFAYSRLEAVAQDFKKFLADSKESILLNGISLKRFMSLRPSRLSGLFTSATIEEYLRKNKANSLR